tara:strand:- start:275 stop:565 length:291 start_codon:yes stop_codon:yes gene_type:complete
MEPDFVIHEEGNDLVIELEIPRGLQKDEIKITIEGDYLRVEGRRDLSKEAKTDSFYAIEEKSTNFLKQIGLPINVRDSGAKTEFIDNMLRITIPKQ